MSQILVTGGTGYIGSHTIVELLNCNHRVLVVDNLSNSTIVNLDRIERITGQRPSFIQGDVQDPQLLEQIFSVNNFDAVMHFAGLKAVGTSIKCPLEYYANNVNGTLNLCRQMRESGVMRLVFSSSATVYGEPSELPIQESCPPGQPTNPYGRSKLMIEQILKDLSNADHRLSIAILRYFNPAGSHPSGLMGEDARVRANNLVPIICQVAAGRRTKLEIFGGDYPTRDGTAVRDYIHVQDLAHGHLAALTFIWNQPGVHAWNLGTGRGYSVLELVRAFEKASGKSIPCEIVDRRPGDVAACWADPTKAERELGWKAKLGLPEMMIDVWCWESRSLLEPVIGLNRNEKTANIFSLERKETLNEHII